MDTLNIAGTKVNTVKPSDSAVVVDGKKVTLTEDYMEDSFALEGVYSTIQTVDASAVQFGLEIIGNKLMNSLTGTQDDDIIDGGDGKDTINGGAGNDSLFGGTGNDSLFGEDDDDTLCGGDGTDTLTGGAGYDVFVYTAGKDVITDYTPDEDIISIGAATFADVKATLKGSNAVLTIGKGTLTVNDVKGKTLTITDKDGHDTLIPFTTVTLTDKDESPFAAEAEDWKIDASKRTKAIQITGNAYDNVILGGTKNDTIYGEIGEDSLVGGKGSDKLFGGYDNDTLVGGTGNDTLWGGNDTITDDDGADVFIYKSGDGKDVIVGFDKDDMLQLTGVNISTIIIDKKPTAAAIVFNIDANNSITFKKSETDYYNINGDIYEIPNSSKRLVKLED